MTSEDCDWEGLDENMAAKEEHCFKTTPVQEDTEKFQDQDIKQDSQASGKKQKCFPPRDSGGARLLIGGGLCAYLSCY